MSPYDRGSGSYPTRKPKCTECGAVGGSHNAYCSKNPRFPTPKDGGKDKTDKSKSHPLKRKDDGRRRKT